MSQFILDDQLNVPLVLLPIQQWTTGQRLRSLRPDELILDDRVPDLLRTVKQPTFLTIDGDFWNRRLCHPDYGILFFALTKEQQGQIPDLLRSLLRRPEFRSRAGRMGKVVRISTVAIDYWQFSSQTLTHSDWQPRPRRRKL